MTKHTLPVLSNHFRSLETSVIRRAKLKYDQRPDHAEVKVINLAIGNVRLPVHPAIFKRIQSLGNADSPFADGIFPYSNTRGFEETQKAVLNVIAGSGLKTEGLYCQITEGGSQAMELMVVGVCGNPGTDEHPLLLLDAAYTNYMAFAKRVGRKTVHITRRLGINGQFEMPDIRAIESLIKKHNPRALLIIPSDNPTGQHMSPEILLTLAKMCVKYNLWLVSDETYRELHYTPSGPTSIWTLNEETVPGITGRRIGIESVSKVWNGCGLRIGAIVSDNKEFIEKSVAENMSNLCANVIGQYIVGALAHESKTELQRWFQKQRKYYSGQIKTFVETIRKEIPGIIASNPDAAIYTVLDVKDLVKPGFDANEFVNYCAERGRVAYENEYYTVLVSSMSGFYKTPSREDNPGKTQMRIAYVSNGDTMAKVPYLFKELLRSFETQRLSKSGAEKSE